MKTLIHATSYDFAQYKEDQYITFDETILSTGLMKDYIPQGEETIDCQGHLVLPGFCLLHTHIYSTFARGLVLPTQIKTFQDTLDQIWWKLDRNLDLSMVYHSGIVFAHQALRHGITTLFDHHASGAILGSLDALNQAVVKTAGMRGCFCFETSDRFSIPECIEENQTFYQRHQDAFSRGMFGLHSSLSLSDETLLEVKKQLREMPIHIHVAESSYEQAMAQHHHHKRAVERLEEFSLIQPHSLLVHGLFLSENEKKILKHRQAHVVVNPTSNQNNGVGFPTPIELNNEGIPVLIGNDGMSQAITPEYKSLYLLTKLKHFSPEAYSLDDLKSSIIQGYAYTSQCFNIQVGRIQSGYHSDLQIIPYDYPTPLNQENIMGHLVYGMFDDWRPRDVLIQGIFRLRNGQNEVLLETLYHQAKASAVACWNKIKEDHHANDEI